MTFPSFSDDDMLAWLQYPLDTDLPVDNVVSYLPSLLLDMTDEIGKQSDITGVGLTQTPAAKSVFSSETARKSVFETHRPEEIGNSLKAASFLPYVKSMFTVAGDKKQTLNAPGSTTIVEPLECLDRSSADVCPSSIEPVVTGRSLRDPNIQMDLHGLHSAHDVVRTLPDGTHKSTCADGAHFSDAATMDEIGGFCLSKAKSSNDCKSEDPMKQSLLSQTFSAKRSRAAEVHSKSERKRRERINENLKALQELIPNANKTDKASLLGKAIEYLKTLQSQIMVISNRTGIPIPPVLLSHGMRHPHMPPHMFMSHGMIHPHVPSPYMLISHGLLRPHVPPASPMGTMITTPLVPALIQPVTMSRHPTALTHAGIRPRNKRAKPKVNG